MKPKIIFGQNDEKIASGERGEFFAKTEVGGGCIFVLLWRNPIRLH